MPLLPIDFPRHILIWTADQADTSTDRCHDCRYLVTGPTGRICSVISSPVPYQLPGFVIDCSIYQSVHKYSPDSSPMILQVTSNKGPGKNTSYGLVIPSDDEVNP
jgi:hypothetical protein